MANAAPEAIPVTFLSAEDCQSLTKALKSQTSPGWPNVPVLVKIPEE